MADVDGLLDLLRRTVKGKGLEIHPFQLGWYNSKVEEPFRFSSFPRETLAVCVLSTPDMFDQLFLPYIRTQYRPGQLDPLDQCVKEYLLQVQSDLLRDQLDVLENRSDVLGDQSDVFGGYQMVVIQDYELDGMRRPKVLVQTAGHVSGATYYYQRSDVHPDPWGTEQKIFGVSVHPKYGGWFAFRAVIIFHGVLAPLLERQQPIDCVPSREQRVELLEQFNYHWREWPGFRDIVESGPVQRYSKLQQEYFGTEPRQRFGLIDKLRTA